jgi:hypothetical protein
MGRHRKAQVTDLQLPDSATTSQFDVNRPLMVRIKWVFNRILDIIPITARDDMRYIAMKTMMMESIKDLARIPDEQLIPRLREISQAFGFIADGDMEEIEAAMAAEQLENAGD